MTDEHPVNAGENRTKKPGTFKKGDPRINRKGRPKSFDAFRDLIQSMMNEPALDANGRQIVKDGRIVTNAEMFIEAWMKSKDRKSFAEFAYGKPKEEIDVTSGGKPLSWKEFISGNTDTNPDGK